MNQHNRRRARGWGQFDARSGLGAVFGAVEEVVFGRNFGQDGGVKQSKLSDPKAIEDLRQVILSTEAFKAHSRPEPEWEATVAKLQLPGAEAAALVNSLKRLWLLPFADTGALGPMSVIDERSSHGIVDDRYG